MSLEAIYIWTFAVYVVLLLLDALIWLGIRSSSLEEKGTEKISFSIIVPVRNEAKNITPLLKSISLSEYPMEYMEVIIIDDHSEDNSIEVAKEFYRLNPDLDGKVIQLPDGKYGKKRALEYGISNAKHSYLVQTDGDCTIKPNWLKYYNYHFQQGANFVFGTVIKKGWNFVSYFDELEQIILTSIGAVTFILGKPTMCNGANLGYKKEMVPENGFGENRSMASGDDEFLLKYFFEKDRNKVVFEKSGEMSINTKATGDLRRFLLQRIRWASKWRKTGNVFTMILPSFFFLFYSIYGYELLCSLLRNDLEYGLVIFSSKALVDTVFVSFLLIHFQKISPFFFVLISQVIYPFYLFSMTIMAFKKNYVWKGRKVK